MALTARHHYNVALYITNSIPTEDDTFIIFEDGSEHLLEIGSTIYYSDPTDENNDKIFVYTGNRFETDANGNRTEKAIYRELSDARHVEQLQTIITALQTRINSLENPVVTEGTLSANLSNITGNNTEYDILFSDTSNASLWKEGKITLPTGLYHFSLILHLADVPLATNFIYVAVKIQPSDSTKTLQTFPYRVDADRLVRSTGALNVDTKSSYFRVTEESEVYFTVRVDGGGTDTIDLNSGTRVLIWR